MADDEPLESGYGPQTSPGDNLCNDFVQESARSFAAFASARGDRLSRLDGIVTMADAGSPVPFFNRAMLEQPIEDLERVLHELRAFYCGTGSETPFLLDSAWPTPDLRPHGFALMGHPPLMLRPARTSAPPAPARAPHCPRRRRPDGARLRVHARLRLSGRADAAGGRRHDPHARMPYARRDGITSSGTSTIGPVTAGSAYVDDRLVRVDNIATLDAARGRGYGAAITAAAVAVDPSKPATLIASDLGRPVYEHLGFVALLRVTYWLGIRSALALG